MGKRREGVYGEYFDWVRGRPCLCAFAEVGPNCFGGTVGHHVKTVGAGGKDERNLVALCVVHHTEVHGIGRRTFEDKYGVDLDIEADNLWCKWRAAA